MVTVIGQVNVAPAGSAAAVPLEAMQAPVVTVAPTGTPALATHVALVAIAVPELVQVIVPVNTAPGGAIDGRPVMTTPMSVPPAVTVRVAVSHCVAFGADAQTR